MHRPRKLWCVLLTPTLFVLVLAAAGCGGSEHDALIRKFFNSAKYNDNATVANIATVTFDPQKDGTASGVSVVSETPEQSKDVDLAALDKAYKDAKAAEDEFSKRKNDYQDKNLSAIERVLKAESSKARVGGADAAVQTAWTKWREEAGEHSKKVSEAKSKLNAARRVADLSLPDKDATTYQVTEFTKELTVSAKVTPPGGQAEPKTILMTLQRVVLKDSAGALTEGKWMITSLKVTDAAK